MNVAGPVGLVPRGQRKEVAGFVGGRIGRGIETRSVGPARRDGFGHFIVDRENRVFGAVRAGADDFARRVFDAVAAL